MTNIELLHFCKQHPEPFFDLHYSKQTRKLVISRDADLPNALQQANALIRRNITALEALAGKYEETAEIKLAAEMVDALEQEGINNSEFTSYWVVNDVSVSIYRSLQKEDRCKFVLEMAKKYIQDRHGLYSAYGYSDTTLQVKADSFAHKRSDGILFNRIFLHEGDLKSHEEDAEYRLGGKMLQDDKSGESLLCP